MTTFDEVLADLYNDFVQRSDRYPTYNEEAELTVAARVLCERDSGNPTIKREEADMTYNARDEVARIETTWKVDGGHTFRYRQGRWLLTDDEGAEWHVVDESRPIVGHQDRFFTIPLEGDTGTPAGPCEALWASEKIGLVIKLGLDSKTYKAVEVPS